MAIGVRLQRESKCGGHAAVIENGGGGGGGGGEGAFYRAFG